MKAAYVDSSWVVAIAFDEAGAGELAERLMAHDLVLSANLLEAELRSALMRKGEGRAAPGIISRITWIYPEEPLTQEFGRVLGLGYQKGADLWHLACALHSFPKGGISFLTLDERQKQAAAKLGFST